MHPNGSTHPRTVSRICEQCGVPFLAERYNVERGIARFCSRACLGASQQKPRTACLVCGTTTPRAAMKYCSPVCYRAAKIRSGAERFWLHVDKSGACWLWMGARLPKGYGLFGGLREDGTRHDRLAHRVSWELQHGAPPPDDRMVCHTCDNPPCVNPAHLFLGDASLNAADMIAKGRGNAGKKLTAADAVAIRAANAPDRPAELALAARYHVHLNTIRDVRSRRTWRTA